MCHINITLRCSLTEKLLMAQPGAYFTHEQLRDYWESSTKIRVELSHVPGAVSRLIGNGVTLHRKGNTVCFETETIRTARLTSEAKAQEAALLARSEKDNALWAKKRQRVQKATQELKEAMADLKSFEDARQDSILRLA